MLVGSQFAIAHQRVFRRVGVPEIHASLTRAGIDFRGQAFLGSSPALAARIGRDGPFRLDTRHAQATPTLLTGLVTGRMPLPWQTSLRFLPPASHASPLFAPYLP